MTNSTRILDSLRSLLAEEGYSAIAWTHHAEGGTIILSGLPHNVSLVLEGFQLSVEQAYNRRPSETVAVVDLAAPDSLDMLLERLVGRAYRHPAKNRMSPDRC